MYIINSADRYTLMRDDILARGEMISTTLRAVMIYQVSDLDKKILQKIYPFLQYFLANNWNFDTINQNQRHGILVNVFC